MVNSYNPAHGETFCIDPGYIVLRGDDAVVVPVCEIRRGEYMIVLHAKPILPCPFGRYDVVRAIIDRPFGYIIRIRIGSQKNRDISLRGRSMIALRAS